MKKLKLCIAGAAGTLVFALVHGAPSVYPTGTTTYDPDRAWSGYTVLSPLGEQAAVVIDMNGNVVKRWEGFNNSAGGPARILPGGQVIGAVGSQPGQESVALEQRDFDGNLIWRFDRNEQVTTRDGETIWSARQHHDWQREDMTAGSYSPGVTPAETGANMLILTHTTHRVDAVAEGRDLNDDRIIEVTPDGEIVWEWSAALHIEEFGFSDAAREAIASGRAFGGGYDWIHLNSATWLGPNRRFDAGDERFDPRNIIVSSRTASLVAIIDRDSGSVVWQLGPDVTANPDTSAIRQIIGQHDAQMIAESLPGAGNILIFDNGGSSGFGPPSPIAPGGSGVYARATSRILEIDPVTFELVWSYDGPGFYALNISGVQRLPNGNTLITEGPGGRLFEVTTEGEIVWEYIHPVYVGARESNSVYRAYRVPYGWIPQLQTPAELAVVPPSRGEFRVP